MLRASSFSESFSRVWRLLFLSSSACLRASSIWLLSSCSRVLLCSRRELCSFFCCSSSSLAFFNSLEAVVDWDSSSWMRALSFCSRVERACSVSWCRPRACSTSPRTFSICWVSSCSRFWLCSRRELCSFFCCSSSSLAFFNSLEAVVDWDSSSWMRALSFFSFSSMADLLLELDFCSFESSCFVDSISCLRLCSFRELSSFSLS